MDNLYGWNEKTDSANRNKNLNNLIYRLKGQLAAGGLPERDYVEIRDGMCFFKEEIPLRIDALEFEKTIELAKREKGKKRRQLLWKANEIFCGELLPANLTEMWFFQKSRHYKELYIWSVEELERELWKGRDYKNRLLLYERAAAIYPFENWQLRQMRCNLELYRYDEALRIYNETMELYAREMDGTAPTEEMQECFEKLKLMDENHRKSAGEAGGLENTDRAFRRRWDDIAQSLFAGENRGKAYYCTYPSFVDYCRLLMRTKERSEFSAVLMFFTLSRKKTQKFMDLPEQMQILKEVLGDCLRAGDAYTRYGSRHFILMLVNTETKCCSTIFRRVEKAYVERAGKGDLWYHADMTRELGRTLI